MKKSLALILSVVLVLSLFVGCGSSNATEPEPTVAPEVNSAPESMVPEVVPEDVPEPEAAPEPEPAPEEAFILPLTEDDITLTYWIAAAPHYMNLNVDFNDFSFYQEMEARTGVQVEITNAPFFQASELLMIMFSSGEYLDMIDRVAENYALGLDSAYENDIIIDLTDYLDEFLPNYKALMESDPNYKRNCVTNGGHILAANILYSVTEPITTGLVIRKDWLDALDMDYPTTYDEMHDALAGFNSEFGGGTLWQPQNLGVLAQGFDAKTPYGTEKPFIVRDGQVLFSPITDEFKEYLILMNQWMNEGLIYPDYASVTTTCAEETEVASGKVGVWLSNLDDVDYHNVTLADDGVYVTGQQMVTVNAGDENHLRAEQVWTGNGTSVTTSCENLEIALRWIDYGYTEEGALLSDFGLEHEAFEYDAQGEPQLTELVLNNGEYSTIQALGVYTRVNGSWYCDGMRHQRNISEAKQITLEKWSMGDTNHVFSSKITLSSEDSDVFNSYYNDLELYVIETYMKMFSGEMDIEENWDAYVEQVKAMNLDKCIEIYQAAYENYMSR